MRIKLLTKCKCSKYLSVEDNKYDEIVVHIFDNHYYNKFDQTNDTKLEFPSRRFRFNGRFSSNRKNRIPIFEEV